VIVDPVVRVVLEGPYVVRQVEVVVARASESRRRGGTARRRRGDGRQPRRRDGERHEQRDGGDEHPTGAPEPGACRRQPRRRAARRGRGRRRNARRAGRSGSTGIPGDERAGDQRHQGSAAQRARQVPDSTWSTATATAAASSQAGRASCARPGSVGRPGGDDADHDRGRQRRLAGDLRREPGRERVRRASAHAPQCSRAESARPPHGQPGSGWATAGRTSGRSCAHSAASTPARRTTSPARATAAAVGNPGAVAEREVDDVDGVRGGRRMAVGAARSARRRHGRAAPAGAGRGRASRRATRRRSPPAAARIRPRPRALRRRAPANSSGSVRAGRGRPTGERGDDESDGGESRRSGGERVGRLSRSAAGDGRAEGRRRRVRRPPAGRASSGSSADHGDECRTAAEGARHPPGPRPAGRSARAARRSVRGGQGEAPAARARGERDGRRSVDALGDPLRRRRRGRPPGSDEQRGSAMRRIVGSRSSVRRAPGEQRQLGDTPPAGGTSQRRRTKPSVTAAAAHPPRAPRSRAERRQHPPPGGQTPPAALRRWFRALADVA